MEDIAFSDTEMKEDMFCVSVGRHFSSFMRATTEYPRSFFWKKKEKFHTLKQDHLPGEERG